MLACGPPCREPVPEAPDAAERRDRLVVDRLVVDVHQPGRDPLGQLQPGVDVAGQDAQRQPVVGAGGQLRDLVERGERRHRGDRAEDLLLVRGRVDRDVAEHRRPVEQPLVGATGAHRRARRRRCAVTSPCTRSRWPASISGPSATCSRNGSPTGSLLDLLGEDLRCTPRRSSRAPGAGTWPCRSGRSGRTSPTPRPRRPRSRRRRGSTISAELPPSSRCARLRCWPASAPTARPALVEPVNAMTRTAGLDHQRLADVGAARQHLEHTGRQAGLLEDAARTARRRRSRCAGRA